MAENVDFHLKLRISDRIVHEMFNDDDFDQKIAKKTGIDIYDIYSIVGYNYTNIKDADFQLLSEYFSKPILKSEYVFSDFYEENQQASSTKRFVDRFVNNKGVFLQDYVSMGTNKFSREDLSTRNVIFGKEQKNDSSFVLASYSV